MAFVYFRVEAGQGLADPTRGHSPHSCARERPLPVDSALPSASVPGLCRAVAHKAPSEASFRGTEYLTIDLSKGDPVLSTQESISLQFKTRQPNGLLFYSGEGDDYLTVSLRDGGAAVGMTLAKGRLDLHIKPTKVRFDDNQWHKISVHRKVQEISLEFIQDQPHPLVSQVSREFSTKECHLVPLEVNSAMKGLRKKRYPFHDSHGYHVGPTTV
ncbi:Neurexin-3-alpha [Harpegnathos saltator]|uniref:Neurexin-3-alpha n=1 Tax=Harpegnathos saltator TaxID=610380 RepID=E2CAF6_HARSA|nr:Neurexin-3-alpha [Harpegnathos saltator]